MKKIAVLCALATSATLIVAVPVQASTLKPQKPENSAPVAPANPAEPEKEILISTWPVAAAPILSAAIYENRMPCVRLDSVSRPCQRRTVISVRSLDERCWTRTRASVVESSAGVVTVKFSGRIIPLSTRRCINPVRGIASVTVPGPVKSIVDFATGQSIDVTRAVTY